MTELAYPSGLSPTLGGARLQRIREILRPTGVFRFRDFEVSGLSFHSADVRPGCLFFAIPGNHDDGARYIDEALTRGAVAIVCEQPMNLRVPVLVVPSARRALADAARDYYGNPSASISVIGVTGTNGKTTVSHLIRECLTLDGKRVGLLGTIAYEFAGRRIPAATTTPDPVRVQGYLREMVDRRLRACVMEVSSHALSQERTRGVHFKVGVFLNLTQDHLDYHGTMAEYGDTKALMFAELAPGSIAVLNADSTASERMYRAIPNGVRVVTFGRHADAQFRAVDVRSDIDGSCFTMVMPHGEVDLQMPLPGRHNVDNALAAAATAYMLGVSELTIATALETTPPIRGRMEQVGCVDDLRVFVDYAHTHDALEKTCSTLRELDRGYLTVVFGCGGDRDRSKRPLMARAVARYAHTIYLTNDNPRGEDPERILDEIEVGLDCFKGKHYRIPDRAEAIQDAILSAGRREVVLIAGKGHETYQVIGNSVIPFDDAEVARRALRGES